MNLISDVQTQAKTLHLAYRRAKFILERWNSGLNTQITNDATEYVPGITGIQINNLINRCVEFVADYEDGASAKLNTVLALSDLELPDLD